MICAVRMLFCAMPMLACVPQRILAAQPGAQTTLSFVFEDNRVYIPVSTAALKPRWFVLDTGAAVTVLDTAFARELGLDLHGDDMVTGAGGGHTHQQHAGPLQLRIGDVTLDIDDAPVADLATILGPTSGRAPAGIVGAKFFREHIVSLDFQRQRITLFAPAADLAHDFAANIPLHISNGLPFAKVKLELPGARTLVANVLVDLGAKSTLLIPEPYIERKQLRAAFATTVTSALGAGMGGDTYYAFARARFVGFATSETIGIADPIVGLSVRGTLKSDWHEGLLGAEFIAHFRIAFDYAHARLLLTALPASTPQFDMSGAFLVAAGATLHDIVVRDVLVHGPAELAGLRAGDEILTVDGAASGTLGLAKIRALLKAAPPRIVMLHVRRDTQQMDIAVRLQRLL